MNHLSTVASASCVTPLSYVAVQVFANTTIIPSSIAGMAEAASRTVSAVLSGEVVPWPLPTGGPLLRGTGSWRQGEETPLLVAANAPLNFGPELNESIVIYLGRKGPSGGKARD